MLIQSPIADSPSLLSSPQAAARHLRNLSKRAFDELRRHGVKTLTNQLERFALNYAFHACSLEALTTIVAILAALGIRHIRRAVRRAVAWSL